MRHIGTITYWNDERGFGFIQPRGGGERVFVHIKAFNGRPVRPTENDVVTFEYSVEEKDRRCAIRVDLADSDPAKSAPKRDVLFTAMIAVFFLFGIAALSYFRGLPPLVAVWYLIFSLIAFGTYAIDKSIAQRDGWRIAENTLHLLSLFGGWPGALVAQRAFRHKIRKASFLVGFWVTVVLNVGILIFFLSSFGVGSSRF